MTLVELLVVIAIIGLLSAAVLPNLSNTAGTRRVRETARSVSSFIAGTQSQAIGSRTGAGVWFDVLENPIVDDAGVPHAIALDLSLSEIPASYSGESISSAVRVAPDLNAAPPLSKAALAFYPSPSSLTPDPTSFVPPDDGVAGQTLFIRFGTSKVLFLLQANGGGWSAAMDATRNQSPTNTFWPVTTTQGVPYEVLLPPRKNPIRSLTIEPGMAIDLTWTFIGSDPGNWPDSPGSTLNVAEPVQLLYSTTGKPSTVISNGAAGTPILEPFYVLVTSIEAIQKGSSFTSSRSYWVAIEPSGGIPRVAEVNPPTPLPAGPWVPTTRAQLIDTQLFIRDAALQTGG
jgi:prepilin-type N-terminal cleavage/methylation domain-containing protein